jgi:hypothetical protein
MDSAKLAMSRKLKYLRTKENVYLKMKRLFIWIPYQQVKGDNMNSVLIMQKVKRIFDNLKSSLYW